MKSLILSTTAKAMLPLTLVFSVFIVLRGHNEPGGGFIGGLAGSAAFALYVFAFGAKAARTQLLVQPMYISALGLFIAAGSGFYAWFNGEVFMRGFWTKEAFPVIGKIGTPFIFDIGVYLVVVGVMLTIILELAEE